MAGLRELEQALINADKAGDANAARALAQAIAKMRAEGNAQPQRDVVAEYNDMPWYQQAGTAVNDMGRLFADGASFGYGDKFAARMNSWIGDQSYEDALAAERQATADSRARSGWAGTAAEIGGAIAPAMLLGRAGLTPFAMVNEGAGLGSRVLTAGAAGGLEGAGYGALNAAGHDQPIEEGAKSGAAWGVAGGAGGELLSSAVNNIAGWVGRKLNPRQSVEQLEATKNAAYNEVDQIGAKYKPESIDALTRKVRREAERNHIHPQAHPRATATLESFEKIRPPKPAPKAPFWPPGQTPPKAPPREPVPLSELDNIRQVAKRDIPGETSGELFANIFLKNIDDFTERAGSRHVVTKSGDPHAANEALKRARDMNTRLEKMKQVEEALMKGERRAASSGTGTNVDNAMRQNVRGILDSPAKSRGFTPTELELADKVVRGTSGGNFARTVGNKMNNPFAIGAGSTIGTILSGGNPAVGAAVGATVPWLVGRAGQALGARSTHKAAETLLDAIANGGRLPPPNAVQRAAPTIGRTAGRALTMSEIKKKEEEERKRRSR